jgi:hypothetical protein
VLSSGNLGSSYAEAYSQSGTGYWEVTVDTSMLPSETGRYDIELYDPSTGARRWVRSALRFQVIELFGPDGEAPVPDQAVTTRKIRDNAVTDEKIGNRTVDDTISTAYLNTGSLTTLLSWIVKRLKEVMGTSTWRDSVPISLQALRQHATRHASGGPDAITPDMIGAAPAVHTHPVATPTSPGFMSAADKAKLDSLGSGSGGGGGFAFRHVRVNGVDISASTAEDRLTLLPGANIQFEHDAVLKTITISVRQGPGSGLDADTVDGQHAANLGGGSSGGGGGGGSTSVPTYYSYYQSSETSGIVLSGSWQAIPSLSVSVPAGTYVVMGSATFAWADLANGYTAILGCRAGGVVQAYQPYKRGAVTDVSYNAGSQTLTKVANELAEVSGTWQVTLGASGAIELVAMRTSAQYGTIRAISGSILAIKVA